MGAIEDTLNNVGKVTDEEIAKMKAKQEQQAADKKEDAAE